MATPNEKEDTEVYPVVILDPNGKIIALAYNRSPDPA